jgi:hypothetical protein
MPAVAKSRPSDATGLPVHTLSVSGLFVPDIATLPILGAVDIQVALDSARPEAIRLPAQPHIQQT